jgi:aquaporin Z
MPVKELPIYVGAQIVGGVIAAGVIMLIADGAKGGYDASTQGLAANGFGAHSPGGFSMIAGLATEAIMTFIFLFVILGATSKIPSSGPSAALGGLAIGLCLVLIHLVSIPVTNTSVNPARSIGPAIFVGGWALEQLWLFLVAPTVGAAAAGLVWRQLEPKS